MQTHVESSDIKLSGTCQVNVMHGGFMTHLLPSHVQGHNTIWLLLMLDSQAPYVFPWTLSSSLFWSQCLPFPCMFLIPRMHVREEHAVYFFCFSVSMQTVAHTISLPHMLLLFTQILQTSLESFISDKRGVCPSSRCCWCAGPLVGRGLWTCPSSSLLVRGGVQGCWALGTLTGRLRNSLRVSIAVCWHAFRSVRLVAVEWHLLIVLVCHSLITMQWHDLHCIR